MAHWLRDSKILGSNPEREKRRLTDEEILNTILSKPIVNIAIWWTLGHLSKNNIIKVFSQH